MHLLMSISFSAVLLCRICWHLITDAASALRLYRQSPAVSYSASFINLFYWLTGTCKVRKLVKYFSSGVNQSVIKLVYSHHESLAY